MRTTFESMPLGLYRHCGGKYCLVYAKRVLRNLFDDPLDTVFYYWLDEPDVERPSDVRGSSRLNFFDFISPTVRGRRFELVVAIP